MRLLSLTFQVRLVFHGVFFEASIPPFYSFIIFLSPSVFTVSNNFIFVSLVVLSILCKVRLIPPCVLFEAGIVSLVPLVLYLLFCFFHFIKVYIRNTE